MTPTTSDHLRHWLREVCNGERCLITDEAWLPTPIAGWPLPTGDTVAGQPESL